MQKETPDQIIDNGLLRSWDASTERPQVVNRRRGSDDEQRGIAQKTFTRSEVMRIQRQWENYEHQSMMEEPAYTEEPVEGLGVFRTVGKLWTRYRKFTQQEDLKRQVEEQRTILQMEAARLRNEKEIEEMRIESIRNKTEKEDNLIAAPRKYRETLSKGRTDDAIGINDPTPTSTGNGMAVQFNVSSHSDESITPQEEMVNEIAMEEEDESNSHFSPYILPKQIMVKIAGKALPSSLLFSKWKRLYSLHRDGDSFETMLRLVKNNEKTLMVIRTTNGDVFGGFADTAWKKQHNYQQGGKFYGGGQCVLYRVTTKKGADGKTEQNGVKTYKWTGINRFCQLCDGEKSMIAMGGGGGAFGFCVVDDFRRGSTGRCDTFANESLLSDGGEDFEILDVEVWGFTSGFY